MAYSVVIFSGTTLVSVTTPELMSIKSRRIRGIKQWLATCAAAESAVSNNECREVAGSLALLFAVHLLCSLLRGMHIASCYEAVLWL